MKATVSVQILLAVSVLFSVGNSQTALPARIVHRESGIALVLIPAGRFQMGCPENDPNVAEANGSTSAWW